MSNVKTKFYTKRVKMIVDEAAKNAVSEIALQLEGQTKANIVANDQVDTGFMLNSVYSVTASGSTYGKTDGSGTQLDSAGEFVERKIAPEANVDVAGGEAAVCVGAVYAVYQEARKSFLLRAAEMIAPKIGAIVKSEMV